LTTAHTLVLPLDGGVNQCVVSDGCAATVSSTAQLSVLPDYNGDGYIKAADLSVLLSQFSQNAEPAPVRTPTTWYSPGIVGRGARASGDQLHDGNALRYMPHWFD